MAIKEIKKILLMSSFTYWLFKKGCGDWYVAAPWNESTSTGNRNNRPDYIFSVCCHICSTGA
ncbi:MAG TPA: hypothetical protein VMW53_01580 [archaeon]|nr:hypothetical protein [archaeon]